MSMYRFTSQGTGGVIFEHPDDARRTVSIFDGKTLDGSVISLKINGKTPAVAGPYEAGDHMSADDTAVVSKAMKRRYEY